MPQNHSLQSQQMNGSMPMLKTEDMLSGVQSNFLAPLQPQHYDNLPISPYSNTPSPNYMHSASSSPSPLRDVSPSVSPMPMNTTNLIGEKRGREDVAPLSPFSLHPDDDGESSL